jgi:folate-binding protein YgfZ
VGELIEDYTPLEIGYQNMISESKGCYTGQEIIARQITYDKITKNLVGMKLDRYVDVGSSLIAGEKSVGTLTSVVQSPRFGIIGLGVVRRQFCELGTKLIVPDAPDAGIIAEVSKLPFA